MNKIYNPARETWSKILKRPTANFSDIEETVKGIFTEIQKKGDKAVAKYTSLFDGISLTDIQVSDDEIQTAISLVSDELKELFEL